MVGKLAWILGGLTVLAITLGVIAVAGGHGDVALELGRGLLTLATVSIIAGLVSVLMRQVDDRRAERSAWEALLGDLIAAYRRVEVAQLLLRADLTASTYRDQFAEIVCARAELRGVTVGRASHDYPGFRDAVKEMRCYIDALGEEYEKNYHQVALQQQWDKQQLRNLSADMTADQAAEVALHQEPDKLSAEQMLRDEDRFPRLIEFLDDKEFRRSRFRSNYKLAMPFLEGRAGISRFPSDAGQSDDETADEDTAAPAKESGAAVQTSHRGA